MTDNQNGHVDGDDYTREAGPVQAGAVLYPADNGGPQAANDSPAAWAADIGRLAAGMWVALGNLEGPAEPDTDSPEAWRAAVQALDAGTGPGTAAAWVERWQRQARLGGAGPDLRTLDQVERDDVAALHRRMAALEATVTALVKVLEVRL